MPLNWGIRFWFLSTVTIHFLWKLSMDLKNTIVKMALLSTSFQCCSLRTLQKMKVGGLHRNQTTSQYTFFSKTSADVLNVHRNSTVLAICRELNWKGFLPRQVVFGWVSRIFIFLLGLLVGICVTSWQSAVSVRPFCFCFYFPPRDIVVFLCHFHSLLRHTWHSFYSPLPSANAAHYVSAVHPLSSLSYVLKGR